MSTRAIIGIKRNDGSILGAWQWNDGNDLEELLNCYFGNDELAEELVQQGVFSSLMTTGDAERVKRDLLKIGICSNYIPFHGAAVFPADKRGQFFEGVPTVYADLEDALGQDINYVYLWENGRWQMYE